MPPSGVEGVGANDSASRIATADDSTAFAFGALAIGNVKYRVHTSLLQQMRDAEKPIYLAYDEAFATASDIVAGS